MRPQVQWRKRTGQKEGPEVVLVKIFKLGVALSDYPFCGCWCRSNRSLQGVVFLLGERIYIYVFRWADRAVQMDG